LPKENNRKTNLEFAQYFQPPPTTRGEMAKNKKLQIAFIGGGMIANAHMSNFHDDRRTEIRGLAELNKTALKNTGAEYGIPHLTTDYKALLKDPEIDAIVVCTPPGLH
jgi:myo-inositol 2-dehydrogenase/D-chiro-inositol 1-dehydrogenase